jgi:hypothetical protein
MKNYFWGSSMEKSWETVMKGKKLKKKLSQYIQKVK